VACADDAKAQRKRQKASSLCDFECAVQTVSDNRGSRLILTTSHSIGAPGPRPFEIPAFDVKTPVIRGPHGDENHIGSRGATAHHRDFSHWRQCGTSGLCAANFRHRFGCPCADRAGNHFSRNTHLLGDTRLHTFPHRRCALTPRKQRHCRKSDDTTQPHSYFFHSFSL